MIQYDATWNMVYSAQFTIEAVTPLSIGSGDIGYQTDRVIAKDIHGLPYIPGSGLAGVLRHELSRMLDVEDIDSLFGSQKKSKDDQESGSGSKVILSAGHLLSFDGKTVIEGIQDIHPEDPYFKLFQKLPERDHVRISHKGVAEEHGKFDEEVVYRGTRFVFSIDLLGNSGDRDNWRRMLHLIHSPFFRIGGGTRKGFGAFKVIEGRERIFHLSADKGEDLQAYMDTSSSLNRDLSDWDLIRNGDLNDSLGSSYSKNYQTYSLKLTPESFFHFGAGYGDQEADMIPKKELAISWNSQGIIFNKMDGTKPEGSPLNQYYLIPATSIKGALAHRVAYHYNALKKNFLLQIPEEPPLPVIDVEALVQSIFSDLPNKTLPTSSDDPEWKRIEEHIESITEKEVYNSKSWKKFEDECTTYTKTLQDELEESTGETENEAVLQLFGSAKSDSGGMRGRVFLSDVYLDEHVNEKLFNHVSIDRFTGGARRGALYQIKALQYKKPIHITIHVDKKAFETDDDIRQAFEKALSDLVTGHLQLGGNTTKGHGAFNGHFKIQ